MGLKQVEIGDCKLILGDCLEVIPKMPSDFVHTVLVDPPYGMSYQSNMVADVRARLPKIANDLSPFIDFLNPLYRVCVDPSCLICFCRWDSQEVFHHAINKAGWNVKAQLIWHKGGGGIGDLSGCPAMEHEVAWFAHKGKFKFDEGRPSSVLGHRDGIGKVPPAQMVHQNQKPEPLMRDLIKYYCKRGATVIDPCMGSGTTGVACVQMARKFIGIEIEERSFEIACERIETAVKKRSVGETYEGPIPMKLDSFAE